MVVSNHSPGSWATTIATTEGSAAGASESSGRESTIGPTYPGRMPISVTPRHDRVASGGPIRPSLGCREPPVFGPGECLLLFMATDTLVSMSGPVADLFDRAVAPTVADLAEVAMDAVYLGVGA